MWLDIADIIFSMKDLDCIFLILPLVHDIRDFFLRMKKWDVLQAIK